LRRCFAARVPQSNNLQAYIQHFQRNGHLRARLDPLGLRQPLESEHTSFQLEHWQLNELEAITGYPLDYRVTSRIQEEVHSLRDLQSYLASTYCASVGVEFEHIQSEDERLWLYEQYENAMKEPLTPSEKIKMCQLLIRTEEMEKFLQKRFATHKRYSSEGSESITVALNSILAEASRTDAGTPIEYAVLGMPHRGRLATLVVVNDYPARNLFHKVKGNNEIPEEIVDRIDDMPTHIAVSNTKVFSAGGSKDGNREVTLTMIHNPSHLESQNAITMGKARAKQDDYPGGFDKNWRKVINLQGHGDAAFTGQGAAYEALSLCKLPKFTTNGTIHFITNNQVGFTTDSKDARSFPFASDIVKPFGTPILRVNAHDVEAVARVAKLAVRYWQTYGKDVLIDMIGFRKYGHNEVDEPAFTQPRMYEAIRAMKSVATTYAEKLVAEGTMKEAQVTKITEQTVGYFEEEFKASESIKPNLA